MLSSWNSIQKRVKEYTIMLLLLETGMLGVFCSIDLFLFYIFWEAMLIPMYFIIGIWGGSNRIYARDKILFVYDVRQFADARRYSLARIFRDDTTDRTIHN